MKTKFFTSVCIVLFSMFLTSCNLLDDDGKNIGGEPSPMGEVGNEFDVIIPSFPGVDNTLARVTAQNGDVSTITYSAEITDPTLLNMVKAMPDVNIEGNTASVSRDYRITTKGFQSVYEEGNLTIMDYDAKVGDKYTLKHNGNTIVREVKEVSKEDEYPWGLMYIKAIHVEEKGRNIPGVSKIEFVGNHRWGMVGIIIHFEDGSEKTIGIYSNASN